MNQMPMFSVIISSPSTEVQAASSRYFSSLFKTGAGEVICPSPAASAAEAFNQAAAITQGEFLILSRGQIEFLAKDFHSKLLEHMQHCDLLGLCGTTLVCGPNWIGAGMPHVYGQVAVPNPKSPGWTDVLIFSVQEPRSDGMQALDGMFLCVRRNVLELLQFDANTFQGQSGYDVDFTYRAYRQGLRLSVAYDLYPICESLPAQDFEWLDSARRFDRKYEGQLPIHLRQRFQVGIVSVANRAEIIEVMSPPHWKTQV